MQGFYVRFFKTVSGVDVGAKVLRAWGLKRGHFVAGGIRERPP